MNIAQRIHRRVYDLAVRLRLCPYRRLWVVPAAVWDQEYAAGKLDHYGELGQQDRLHVVIGMMRATHRQPRVLDIGCGVGILRSRIHPDYLDEYVGVDISAVAVETAKAQRFPKSRFIVGELPAPSDGLFDVIMLTDMMCYVEDLPALLEKLKPFLAQGGRLITLQYSHPGDVALHRDVARAYREIDCVTVKRDIAPKHAWRVAAYTLDDIDPAKVRRGVLEPELRLAQVA